MNIVFACDQYWPSISGVCVSLDAFRKQFTKMGHHVFLLVPDYPDAAEFDKKVRTENVYRFRSHKLSFNDENHLVNRAEKKNVFKTLDAIKPDIIHVHTEFTMNKMATAYAKEHSIPLVMTAHTNWEELIHHYIPIIPLRIARLYCRYIMNNRYNKSDTVIVPTSLMEVLLDLYFVEKPIRVIPTGIDKDDFTFSEEHTINKAEFYEKYPQCLDKKMLFTAGRLGKEKNIEFLLDVVHSLLQTRSDIQFVISGNGPARQELEEYAIKLGISDHVLFTGFIERKFLKTLYTIADVFIFASKVESQGMVALESMACGTPVVAIGKMGTREVMGGDFGGFMVDDELDMFIEKVDLLLTNKELYTCKSKEALKHVDKWTIDLQADRMIKLYKTLIAKAALKKESCYS
jgi:glycosyltransferase involved in cell wall biosynthesis